MKDKWILMNEEDKVCLWNVFSFCRVFFLDFYKFTGLAKYENIFEFDNHHFRGFFRDVQSQKNSQRILDFILYNRKGFSIINKRLKKSSDDFYKFGKKVLTKKPQNLTKKQIVRLFQEYDEIFLQNLSLGMVTTLPDIPHSIFTKKVNDILAGQVSLLKLKSTPFEYFNVLTKIKELSGRQKESVGLLKMYQYIVRKKVPVKELENDRILSKMIRRHIERLCWAYYSYMGPAFGEDRVFNELRSLIKSKINPTKALNQISSDLQRVLPNRQKAEGELKLNNSQKIAIHGLRECLRMKVIRKDSLDYASYSLEGVLREVANRAHISFEDARFIIPGEFEKVLRGDRNIINDLPKRRKYSLVVAVGNKVKLLSGEQGKKFFKKINFKTEDLTEISEVQGQVACPGHVKGTVKIINLPADMHKMKKGDILVSFATIPDLVPAMKKAGAIVTEQGGITSHAAIVSRELRVPCVIGTKIATKVFKDGDFVEVDANKGIVKKIK